MQSQIQIRRWRRLRLGAVLCLSGFALAADTPATTATKPVQPSAPQTAATKKNTKRTATHTNSSRVNSAHGKKSSRKKRGQQAIDSARTREIQSALIREHYLQGEPSGTWDATTQAAMQRYQAAQGWQSKTTPDARALIKLGLGPSNDHLLNPESVMTTAPAAGDP